MGTIVSPSGASCNVAASDAAINNVPNLRTFLSKSLDVAAKARKPIAQAEQILNKQITTIASNPKKYTPAAIQQCTVNLEKASASNPNVDILESLTNTGYMPPEADVPIASGATPGQPVFANQSQAVTEALAPYAGMRDISNASGRNVNDIVDIINNGGTIKNLPDTVIPAGTPVVISGDQALMMPYGSDGPFIPVPSNVSVNAGGEGLASIASSVTIPSSEAHLYDKNGNFITGVSETNTPGIYTFQTVNNDGGLTVYFGANPDTGITSPISSPSQISFTPSHGLGGITGVVGSFMQATGPIGQIAMAFAAPGLGSVLAEEFAAAGLSISAEASTAIAKASLNIAAGQDPTSAIKDAITSAVVQSGTPNLASEIQKGIQAMSDDKYYALLLGGAIASSISSATMAAARGGSTEDIVKAAASGAIGSAAATTTESNEIGRAVAGGLTQGLPGAISGAITGQIADEKRAAGATTSGGVPLPPGGRVSASYEELQNAIASSDLTPDQKAAVEMAAQQAYAGASTAQALPATTTDIGGGAAPGRLGYAFAANDPRFAEAMIKNPQLLRTFSEYTNTYGYSGVGDANFLRELVAAYDQAPKLGQYAQDLKAAIQGVIQNNPSLSTAEIQQIVSPTLSELVTQDLRSTPVTNVDITGQPGTQITTPVQTSGGGETDTGVVYPNIIDITAGYPYKIGQGLDAGVTSGGVTGGLPTIGGALPSTQGNVIPDQITQVPGAEVGTVTFGGQPGVSVDASGLPTFASGYSPFVLPFEVPGAETGIVPSPAPSPAPEPIPEVVPGSVPTRTSEGGRLITSPTGTVGGTVPEEYPGAPTTTEAPPSEFLPQEAPGEPLPEPMEFPEEPLPTEEPIPLEEEPPEKVEPEAVQQPYLVTGGISPRPRPRPTKALSTALQTPFERSLITSGLTSYRGAGEIESPESGGKRSNVWNEASLRLKDALGI